MSTSFKKLTSTLGHLYVVILALSKFSVTIVHTPTVLHILLCIFCAYKYLEQIKIGAINYNGPQPVYQFIVIQICQACDSSMLPLFSKELNRFYLSAIFFSPAKRGPSVRSTAFYAMNPSLVIKTFVFVFVFYRIPSED